MKSNEQKLIDLIFEIGLTINDKKYRNFFKGKNNEEVAKWIADILKELGFETYPCGGSWGILK